MAIYRRFLRAKKGMSTIFGALFFIILVLMGFNLMIWNFVQYDSYNQVISKMSQRDQLTTSENLVVTQPGVVDCCSNGFNITVTNLGGAAITISRIYINNVNPTGQCTSSPCVADPSGPIMAISNTNIQLGELNHKIKVSGISVNDGNAYRIVLASTRGRLFSFYYPWPVTVNNNNGGGSFVTNIGPLSVYFDFKSFNFTQGAQTQSQSAFCVPSSTTMVLWVKLANTATDSSVTLQGSTMMQMQPYSANGFGQFVRTWVVSPTSINPSSITPYNQGTNPYTLPAATANGPSSSVEVYFGGSSQGGTGGVSLGRDDNWLTFIGFYYNYRNQPQGETIPFMDLKSTAGYPGTC
jgi:hypothetical protein